MPTASVITIERPQPSHSRPETGAKSAIARARRRRQAGCLEVDAETWRTWANLVTAIRLVAGFAIFACVMVTRDITLNFIGLGVYWILDVLDGQLARRLHQETRLGAQFDILADRALVAFFYMNYAMQQPHMIVPIAMFLFQFMVLDHYLSNQFIRWPIKSPNYFYLVDRQIWKWNWSPGGKFLNSFVVTAVLVSTHSPVISSMVCGGVLALKGWSAYRLHQLPDPEAQW